MTAPPAASPARSVRRIRLPRRVGLLTVPIAVCLAIAACGGGSTTDAASPPAAAAGQGSPNASAQAAQLAYAECMRSHGDTNFPDPSTHGGYASASKGANAINTASPQFISANKACSRLLPAGPGKAQNEQRMAALVRYAACMRSHGIADFPDPGPNGSLQLSGQGDLSPSDPKFQAAQEACKSLQPGHSR